MSSSRSTKPDATKDLCRCPKRTPRRWKTNDDGGPISAVARLPETSLHPDVDARTALAIFDAAQTDTLAVTERETGVVIGLLGEAFAARRYAQETDLAAKGVLGGG